MNERDLTRVLDRLPHLGADDRAFIRYICKRNYVELPADVEEDLLRLTVDAQNAYVNGDLPRAARDFDAIARARQRAGDGEGARRYSDVARELRAKMKRPARGSGPSRSIR